MDKWTPFNTVLSHGYQSLPIVSKGVKESKGCPIVSFNTAFTPACPSLPFVPKWLMDSKRMSNGLLLILSLALLINPFPLSLRD